MADIFDIFKKLEKNREAVSTVPITHLVVGLGNPGDKYKITRHNMGFMFMDHLCEKYGVSINRSKFSALVGEANIAGKRVLLMKPQTFMNASGEAVQAAADFYKIQLENIIVISDDINLSVGGMRVRAKGSDGGQRGIRDIIRIMGADTFPRIRIGVGAKPNPNYDLADWVLSNFTSDELKVVTSLFPIAADGLEQLLLGDVDKAMQICNRK
jgi:PTH1 family peptidyl-tRNA hydrolase